MELENSSVCICCLENIFQFYESSSFTHSLTYSNLWTLFIYYKNQPLFWDVISQVFFPLDLLTVYKDANFCMAKAL